ncbi:MAG: glutathione S-transferase [Alphaproteobacteria bacterium]|nr:glutathione S-transferase [Alphaproteobacteria bacterium]
MKLRFTPNPNYIHKVLVVAYEAGVADRLTYVRTSPFDDAVDLGRDNPLSKVPTLVLDDGEAIYGGLVICEYLDWLGGSRLFPPPSPVRFTVMTRMVLGDGLFDTMVLLDLESWRPKAEHRVDYAQRQWDKVVRGLDRLERDAPGFAAALDIGQICVAGALSRLDYRVKPIGELLSPIDPTYEWRRGRPTLARWYDAIKQRPAMRFTVDKTGTTIHP